MFVENYEMQITYSPAYTIVPTYECFNRCSYCNFRVDPGVDNWMTIDRARQILTKLQGKGICEILILSGEVHPQSSRRQAWLDRIYDLCVLALDLGFLPHTNAGPLSLIEMGKLAQVNVSMGLMIESLDLNLLQGVHRHAPSKLPAIRLEQLNWAGELKIPFTTGLLLGIGELEDDWAISLQTIADIHTRWGHIQEVILQPYSPGSQESLAGLGFDIHKLPQVIQLARQILPTDITIQIPPNLIPNPDLLLACLHAGARDLGGIVPKDEVNPDYHHLQLSALTTLLTSDGWDLQPRLPVYPRYKHYLSDPLAKAVVEVSDRSSREINKICYNLGTKHGKKYMSDRKPAEPALLAQQLESPDLRDRMVALASLRDLPADVALPLIKKVLNDESLQLRSMAVFALGVKVTSESYPILIDLLANDPDYGIRADAAGALGYLEDIRAFEGLVRAFYEDTDWLVRFSAAVSLGNLKDPRAFDVLMQALDSPEVVLQQAAIAALGEIKAVAAIDRLVLFIEAEDWLVRQRLAESLGQLPTPKSISALKYLTKDSHPHVAAAATICLQRMEE